MNKSEEKRKKWIQWVLDFVQMDLNSLSKIDKKKLALELAYFCYFLFGIEWENFENLATKGQQKIPQFYPPPDYEELERDQLKLRDYLESIPLDTFPRDMAYAYESVFEVEADPSIFVLTQDALKKFVEVIANAPSTARVEYVDGTSSIENDFLYSLPEYTKFLGIYWKGKPIKVGGEYRINEGSFRLAYGPKDASFENSAVLNFADLLDGLDLQVVKKCKGCSHYFLNMTKREKMFCNPSCASRSIVRMKREELKKNPKRYKAYLKRQQEYSKKYYRGKIKAQFAPNNRIKIGRKEG